ncbi:uncharacterized protein Dvir_GJ26326 [Drosophila virilis]|uniref:Uncharacterized protein n=1 Tax=Drosophila virilis TaxID=7244 RepID=A0A0Q9WC78_DROVI|nr:uncharacterized protein LOC26531096 [Drosophila virilis]KRF79847.1 uncharacterized protein Dvir_GJ26326 [Drosophila virilis]
MWSYDPQAFLVYNQISNKHPSQYRKLYWYPTRMPTVPTQKQRMGKFLVTHGYASVREHSPYNGLQIRNTFKNTYDGYLSPQVLRTYLRSAKLPTTSATTTTVNTNFKNIHSDYKSFTNCNELTNLTLPVNRDNANVSNYFKAAESISNIMPKNNTTYEPFVAHTYFTLDDVIVPYSPENFKYKANQEFMSENKLKPQIVAQDKPFANKLTVKMLDDDIHKFEPIKSTETIITTTIAGLQNVKMLDDYIHKFEPIKSTATIIETTTAGLQNVKMFDDDISEFEPIKSTENIIKITTAGLQHLNILTKVETDIRKEIVNLTTLNQAGTTNIPNAILNKTNSISKINVSHREHPRLYTFNKKKCDTCRKSQLSTENKSLGNLTHYNEKPFNGLSTKNASKILKKDDRTDNKFVSLRIKKTQNQKNIGLVNSKSISTTESPQFKNINKTKHFYLRRRKLHANATVLNAYNLTHANTNSSKIIKPQIEQPQNNFTDRRKLRNAQLLNATTNVILARSNADNEVTALAEESAIMTISNNNGKSNRKLHFLDAPVVNHPNFAYTTDLPKLPIEVYFTKLTQN